MNVVFLACRSWLSSSSPGHALMGVVKEQKWQESKPQCTRTCEAAAYTIPVTMPLVEVRHLGKPGIKGMAGAPAHKEKS